MSPPSSVRKKIIPRKKSTEKSIGKTKQFPIVAIGASAGGLEAVTQLLRHLPSDTGMAFVYIQHLSPDYKSILASLLSKSTRMKVIEARNGAAMTPDHFYVIPPDNEMMVVDGHIKLVKRKKTNVANTVDIFFSSLAEKHKQHVVGILLSGSGTDGTDGLKAIKQEGGLTFAQDGSAKFNGMPQNAISKGVVDYVLSPNEMALAIIRLAKSDFLKTGILNAGKAEEIENRNPDLKIILQVLFRKKGIDFSHYKMNTIKRRIIRRMQLHKVRSLKNYAALIGKSNEEVNLLAQDLLIHVTSFFRDPAAFTFLRKTIFPRLLKSNISPDPLRIWIPACATGEEAYTIALLLLELVESKSMAIPVQIFATDLSEEAIRKARNGEYTQAQLAGVTSKQLQQYFVKSKDGYHAGKALRDTCIFAQHNLLSDPPFSRVDFISCCNLLIYLDVTAQKKVISSFHYALKENGYLMVGRSEAITTAHHLFSPVNKKFKIYLRKKKSGPGAIPSITPRFSQSAIPVKNITVPPHQLPIHHNGHLGSAIDAILLSRYIPTSVVINHDMEILEFRGTPELYLRHAHGKASFNIMKMAQPEFAFELRNAIHNASKTKQTIRKTGIELKTESGTRVIAIEVTPLKIEGEEPLLLVLFNEVHTLSQPAGRNKKTATITAKDQRIRKLEDELAGTRADMRSITNDHDTTIEELQSANEEVVSSNEELRTLNEELETSKEEIESTNEELIATNQKLQARNDEVEELNNFSAALFSTMHNPMLVLDKNMFVTLANRAFYELFRLKEDTTVGKKLYELDDHQWNIPELRELMEKIIPKNSLLHNYEVTHRFRRLGEKSMLLNAKQVVHKNSEQKILLLIEDITEEAELRFKEKQLVHELRDANARLESINAELTSFNYITSHDLQEPLRKIRTFATYILKEEQPRLSEIGKDYFRRMQNSITQMQSLIDDLLSYSRTSIADRKFEKTNLTRIVAEVKTEFADILAEKKGTIESGRLCTVRGIPFQLRQLLHNLIGNALKFSQPGRKPNVMITANVVEGNKIRREKLGDELYCHLVIRDNGIGFDAKYKDRIFEIFERLHHKDEYSGTGIGLAICKKIVENHRGIIRAAGKPGKGATFEIYLPLEQGKR